MEWQQYRRKELWEMRPYIPGEDMASISVSKEDVPKFGGMIARNPENHADQWYVAKTYFEKGWCWCSHDQKRKTVALSTRRLCRMP